MSKISYYIVDTETNGLKPGWHEVTEISIVRCSDRTQLTRRIKCEHPERSHEIALEITGKSIPDLLKGGSKLDVVNRCNEFFAEDGKDPEHRCMVAHRASFDKNHCHALWAEVGQEFPANHWMDTIKFAQDWAKYVGKKPENFKLATVLQFAGIKALPGQHNAGADARNTYLLWKKGMDLGINHLPAVKVYRHKLA
ncbi:MAG: 3'-5' exonuclease [Candidatus Hermodarchaeia archaeon]|jgi:DNA polymerase III epsilon subunit-like protein